MTTTTGLPTVAPLTWHQARAMTPIERFWHYVIKVDGCLLWAGALCKGRPRFQAEGKTHNGYVWLWEQVMERPVEDDKELHHTCGQPACVTMSHLQELTHAEHTEAHNGARGGGLTNRAKTHCGDGHPYDYIDSQGKRHCKTCRAARLREFRARRREEVMA